MKIVRYLSLIFSFCLPLVGEIRPVTNSGDWVGKTALEIAPNAKPLGSTKARSGKEMEAIRAANLLTNNDPHGKSWIQSNKDPNEAPAGGRAPQHLLRRG